MFLKNIYHKIKYSFIPKVTQTNLFQKLNTYLAEFNNEALSDAAAAMSYYMLFAIVPLLVFLLAWLSFITESFSFLQNLDFDFNSLMPEVVVDYLKPVIKDVLVSRNTSILSVGVISLLWASSKGFDYFWNKLQAIFNVEQTSYILRRLLGILFIAFLAVFIFLLLIFVAFSQQILDLIHFINPPLWQDGNTYAIITIGIPTIFLVFLMSLLYYTAARGKYKFRHAVIASTIPVLMWIVSTLGLRYYVNQFSRFDILYGSITGIVVLMFWLYLLFYSIFIGAFVQAYILGRKQTYSNLI